jgi:hypothetical protein
MIRKGWKHRALMAVLWLLTGAWLLMSFWLVRPYSNISASPFQVTNGDTFRPGDTLILENEFCWDGTPFESLRVIVGVISESEAGVVRFPNGYVLPDVAAKYEATGCAPSMVRLQLPATQPEGEYRIRYETSYKPRWNPVRVVEFAVESNQFTVTAR